MANEIHRHVALLGRHAKDLVTGYSGVITTVGFDLYGCIQVVVTPPVGKDGESKSGHWFDVSRISLADEPPIMALPDFNSGYIAESKKGCADKPIP